MGHSVVCVCACVCVRARVCVCVFCRRQDVLLISRKMSLLLLLANLLAATLHLCLQAAENNQEGFSKIKLDSVGLKLMDVCKMSFIRYKMARKPLCKIKLCSWISNCI